MPGQVLETWAQADQGSFSVFGPNTSAKRKKHESSPLRIKILRLTQL